MSFWLLFIWTVLVLSVVVLVLSGLIWRYRNHRWTRNAAEHRAWIILGILASGLFFGLLGEWVGPTTADESWLGQLLDWTYLSTLRMAINGEVDSSDSVFIRIARVAALALLVLLAYEAIQLLFAKPLRDLWLSFYSDHVVICGLGRIGKSLIYDLTKTKEAQTTVALPKKIVVIERDKDNPDLDWAVRRGATVVIGDATEAALLRLVRVQYARDVFLVTGFDEANLEGSYDIMRLISQKLKDAVERTEPMLPRIYVQLNNLRLESMLIRAKRRAFEKDCDASKGCIKNALIIKAFNVLDCSMQALLDSHILARRPKKLAEVAHFVIVGFGEAGQALAIKLGQLAHYENLKRSRMTIVHRDSQLDAVKHFTHLYPAFFPTAADCPGVPRSNSGAWLPPDEMDHWEFGVKVETEEQDDPDNPGKKIDRIIDKESSGVTFVMNGGFALCEGDITSDDFVSRVVDLSTASGVRAMIFICNPDDERNCADAIELRDELDVRLKMKLESGEYKYRNETEHRVTIFPFVPNRPMLHELITPLDHHQADLIPWGDCHVSCDYPSLTTNTSQPLAMQINHIYALKTAELMARRNHAEPPLPESIPVAGIESMLSWEQHSNLMAAAHVNAKLAPLRLAIVPPGQALSLTQIDKIMIDNIIEASKRHQGDPAWVAVTADEKLLESVAKMEHNRWLAERLLSDWSFGARAPKGQPENKRRHAFVDWDKLPPFEGVKDRDQVARILEFSIAEGKSRGEPRFVLVPRMTDETLP